MSVLINGVFASREAGALMPSLQLDSLKIQDCVMNVIKLDSGKEKIEKVVNETTNDISYTITPILPDPDNLPLIPNGQWSLETELYANFNGDLEAGPVSFYGSVIDGMAVRRTSNRTNFTKWEDVKIFPVNPEYDAEDPDKTFTFVDNTIESGVWYLYAIQPMSGIDRGSLYKAKKKALLFYDAFLVGENGAQLKLKYNLNMSSFKKNIKETRVETLGSKYPFVVRNGMVEYVEFPLSGLITHFMDESQEFAPRADLFIDDGFSEGFVDTTDDYRALYDVYGINNSNNLTLEREFREKVLAFLTDGKPKLFKSPKYGNMLVRLMDVNATPRQDINGGMVCDFSCNAVEIDEANLDNFDKYNIQKR